MRGGHGKNDDAPKEPLCIHYCIYSSLQCQLYLYFICIADINGNERRLLISTMHPAAGT